jgi:hypothetical protein
MCLLAASALRDQHDGQQDQDDDQGLSHVPGLLSPWPEAPGVPAVVEIAMLVDART